MFNKLIVNNYFYDLFIRYTNVSLMVIFLLSSTKGRRKLNTKLTNIKHIETYLNGNLPIYNNIHLDYSILFTRKLHLTVGKSQDIYNVSTLLRVGNNFLKHFEGDSFFTKIDFSYLKTDHVF